MRPLPSLRRSLAVASVVAALVVPVASAQNDVIKVRSGKDVVGRIEHENLAGLEVSLHRGTRRKLDWSDVVAIEYGGDQVLGAARDDLEGGRVDAARKSLQSLAGDEKQRRPLRQEARIRLARLEDRFGKADDAIAQYRAFLVDFPAGRWFADATSGLVDRLIAAKSPDVARAEYEKGAHEKRLDPDLAARCRLGVARCLRGEGRVADATARLHELAQTEPEVLAGAWNDLADLSLDAGVGKRDGDAIRIALYSYLRGVVQYAPADRGRSPEHRRALAGAAQAFEYEAQLATDPEVKQLARRRAAELRQQLRAR